MGQVMPDVPHVPVIPIRMTEAWLLLDEAQIRRVAGAPNDKTALDLPRAGKVESLPDPKALLKTTLARASGLKGRRLEQFNNRFPQHRAISSRISCVHLAWTMPDCAIRIRRSRSVLGYRTLAS